MARQGLGRQLDRASQSSPAGRLLEHRGFSKHLGRQPLRDAGRLLRWEVTLKPVEAGGDDYRVDWKPCARRRLVEPGVHLLSEANRARSGHDTNVTSF